MKMKSVLACVICLVVGGILGRLLPPTAQAQPGATPLDRSTGPEKARRERPSYAGTSDTEVRPDLPVASGLPSPPEDRDLVVVSKDLINQLSLAAGSRTAGGNLFSQDGALETALQIVDAEKAQLQTAWRASRQKIRDLEASSSTAENVDDGSVRITVPQLTDGMEAAGASFRSSAKEILGDNRGEIFVAMKQVDQVFTPPEGDRTYTVAAEAIGDGNWRFRMTLEGASGRRVWVGAEIPDEIRHLTDAARIAHSLEDSTAGEDDCGE